MFENGGGKLKVFAIVYFWLSSLVCVILAFTIGIRDNHIVAELFVPLLIGGPLSSYFTSLLIYTVGNIDEKMSYTVTQLGMLKEKLQKENAQKHNS